ncbi:uncharacterized protein VTP21DRAFT_2154 [Calcarisporiella thermophila]|uniref:uncharacterized protein n=1 Tax=Calcarisporiella thermophila TaxID=911321 RepID=UPI0037449AA2
MTNSMSQESTSSTHDDKKAGAKSEPNFFADYVIVFRFQPPKNKQPQEREAYEQQVLAGYRQLIEKLKSVELKYEVRPGGKGLILVFVLCQWERLKKEILQSRVQDWLTGVRIADEEDLDVPFHKSKAQERNLGLSEAERLRLVYDILTGSTLDGRAGITPGIDPFVESIMPLHDREFNKSWIRTWSRKYLINQDDLLRIRNHFGEKIAYYFEFLQFYFLWLSVPSIVGVIYYLFGRSFSISFSIFMMGWSLAFTEFWRRRETELAIWWGVRNVSNVERRRAAFKADKQVTDPVTGELVPYFPLWKRWMRRLLTAPAIAVGVIVLSVVVGFVFSVQVFLKEYYNGPFAAILSFAPTITYAALVPTMTAYYLKLSRLLTEWENHETESQYEHHLTLKIFASNFLTAYAALFLCAYVYIPFGEEFTRYFNMFNISTHHQTVGPERLKEQLVYFVITGQIVNFATEILVPMFMRLATKGGQKVIDKIHLGAGEDSPPRDEDEAQFLKRVKEEVKLGEYDIYEDYAEMVTQFGYVSLFSSVWPLTPLCCFINNWIELRSDAVKLCRYTRRPIPQRADSIGPWVEALNTLTWLSSITTSSLAYLYHPKTDIHSKRTLAYVFLTVLVAEHVYVVMRMLTRGIVRSLPSWSTEIIQRQEYELKKRWLERMGRHDDIVQEIEGGRSVKEKREGPHSVFWEDGGEDGEQLLRSAFKSK